MIEIFYNINKKKSPYFLPSKFFRVQPLSWIGSNSGNICKINPSVPLPVPGCFRPGTQILLYELHRYSNNRQKSYFLLSNDARNMHNILQIKTKFKI